MQVVTKDGVRTVDVDLMRRWVKRLRSGQYEQGGYCLRTVDNKYCCLGVLAEEVGATWREPKCNPDYYGLGTAPSQYECIWPGDTEKDAELAGVRNIVLPVEQGKLWRLNDSERKSFAEIADYIESLLPPVETA